MALRTEQGCGLIVNGKKSLHLARRFEAAHDLFSSPCVSMRSFWPVVQPLVRAVLDAWAKPPDGDAIAAELVGHNDPRYAPSPHQFSKKSLGSMGIPTTLDQDLQHVAIRIDRPPKPVLLASE